MFFRWFCTISLPFPQHFPSPHLPQLPGSPSRGFEDLSVPRSLRAIARGSSRLWKKFCGVIDKASGNWDIDEIFNHSMGFLVGYFWESHLPWYD